MTTNAPLQGTLTDVANILYTAMARLDAIGTLEEDEIRLESSRNAQIKGLAETYIKIADSQIEFERLKIEASECLDANTKINPIPLLGLNDA